jgi:hypothetical protein
MVEELHTPERDRQSEREWQRVQQLQMTSPSTRRHRILDRQQSEIPLAQPNFGQSVVYRPLQGHPPLHNDPFQPSPSHIPHVPYQPWYGGLGGLPPQIDWNEQLQQGFNAMHNERIQQRNRRQALPLPLPSPLSLPQHLPMSNTRQGSHYEALLAERLRPQQERDRRLAEVASQHQVNQVEHQAQVAQINASLYLATRNELPMGCRPYIEPPSRHYLGLINVECSHCHALHFQDERLSNSGKSNPKFGSCCLQGQVKLDPLFGHPPLLERLFMELSPRARKFCDNVRQYNSAFAFTSLGAKLDQSVLGGSGPYAFRLHGGLYHRMGSLLPLHDHEASYAQLYIHDPQVALATQNQRNSNLDPTVMSDLQTMLLQTHPYVALYKQAYQILIDKPPGQQDNLQARIALMPTADC